MENYNNINEAGPTLPKGLSRVRNIDLRSSLAKLVTSMETTLTNKKLFKGDLDLKTFSKTLLKQPGMLDVYFDVANSLSMKKFKKNFNDLDDLAKSDIIKDVDTIWHEELKKQMGEVKKGNKYKTTPHSLDDLKKVDEAIKKHVLGSSIHSLDDLKKLMKNGTKVQSTNGKSFLERFKISKIFSGNRRVSTTNNPSFLRRTMRVIVVNATAKTALLALFKIGAVGYVLSEIFGIGDDENTVFVDEKGKDIFETSGNKEEVSSVLDQFIKSGGTKTKDGGVNVVTPEYPQGLTYYSNGRVLNVATREMGSWMLNEGLSLLSLLNEQEDDDFRVDNKLNNDVETVVDLLDFPVSKNDLKQTYDVLKPYVSNGKGKKFLELYQKTGFGNGSLEKSLKHVFTTSTEAGVYRDNVYKLINKIKSGVTKTTTTTTTSSPTNVTTNFPKTMITWDKGGVTTTGSGGGGTQQSQQGSSNPRTGGGGTPSSSRPKQTKKSSMKFHDCTGKDFPLEFGCVNNRIKDLQSCLGLHPDGKFGPRTLKMLKDYANDVPNNVLTYDIWNNITSSCQDSNNGGLHNIDSENTQGVDLTNNNSDMNVDVNLSPNKFYMSLKKNGNIDTVFAPNGNDTLVRYDGPELAEDDLKKLDTALNGMNFVRTSEPSIRGTYLYKRR